jgi:hypothetical protein
MAAYFYSVVVANCPRARWCVDASPFVCCRYELGVDLEIFRVIGWRFSDHHRALNNKRRDLVWREYHRYFAEEMTPNPKA